MKCRSPNVETAPSGPEIIKLIMLNSDEHEICPANKSQITNNCKFFLAKHS